MNFLKKAFTVLFCDGKKSFKSRLLTCLAVNLGLVFSVFTFIPMETYLGNPTEFIFSFGSLMGVVLTIAVPMFLLMTLVEMLFKGILFRIVTSAVFGVTLASYVQSMFLNGMMKSLDGSYESYSVAQKLINLAIWGIVFLAPIVVSIFWKPISKNINKFGSLAIVAVQLVGILSLLLTFKPNVPEVFPTYKNLYDLSSDKNVIVFVLDRFDNKNIDKILAEDPQYLDKFSGFTYYPNMVGSYIYTQNVVPYLISGVENPDLYVTSEKKAQDISKGTYINTINELTESLNIYSESKFLETSGEGIGDVIENINSAQPKLAVKYAYKPVIKSALYRVAPLFIKSRFNYTSAQFNGAVEVGGEDSVYHCESHEYDALFKDYVEQNGLKVEDCGGKAFKLIHFQGAHFPYNIDANGEYSEQLTDLVTASKGSLSVVYEYIQALKAVDKYKDTAIIVTSDHGETVLLQDVESHKEPNVSPILFYKPSGVDETTSFKVSEAPVSHKNVFPTVIKELGGDPSVMGNKTISDVGENEEVIREFYWSVRDKNDPGEIYRPHKYEIHGDSRKPENWKYIGPVTD